ncbi:MAG: enoyl-CoA hydratase/isomerase family protein [Ignavibacterium sp.]|jgi:methylglutaconyl-CoA hydratase|nr:enoyl-CoA hydratase/isomerase family protein [Ignavibacterium sp.]
MIKSEIINNTAVITLNRPEKRNALHPFMVEQMKGSLKEFADNDVVHSLIITGEGNTFCAGADLEYLNNLSDNNAIENYDDSRSLAEMYLTIYEFPKPTIAAVNGAAIAGGCGLASVCDFILAHPEESKFGYSEVKIGFIPAIVSIFLIKRIGEGMAKQLLLEGDRISGKRAYEIGFVNYLSENVFEKSLSLSEKLNKNSFASIKQTKQMINQISNLSVREAVNHCINLNVISRSTADFKNGINSFLNKDK